MCLTSELRVTDARFAVSVQLRVDEDLRSGQLAQQRLHVMETLAAASVTDANITVAPRSKWKLHLARHIFFKGEFY